MVCSYPSTIMAHRLPLRSGVPYDFFCNKVSLRAVFNLCSRFEVSPLHQGGIKPHLMGCRTLSGMVSEAVSLKCWLDSSTGLWRKITARSD